MKLFATLTIVALSAPSFADTLIVTANASSWSPDVVNCVPGDVLRFEYGTGYPHTITSGTSCTYDGLYFDEPLTSPGDYYEFTVPDDGTTEIPFFCAPHCNNGMTGMINIEGDSPRMLIGIVDASNCEFSFEEDGATSTMTFNNPPPTEFDPGLAAHFGMGVEIENGDVVVDVWAGGNPVYLLDASAETTTIVASGLITLYQGHRYMFSSSAPATDWFSFSISWSEEDEVGVDMGFVGSGLNTVSAMGDDVMFRASELGEVNLTFTVAEETSMQMSAAGNVTCSTLAIPTDGSEGDVEMPVGTHVIELNGDGSGMGLILLQMDGGDDGGGGSMPEDVNGDGVVGVEDLLAIIAAWGSTSP